MVSYFNHAGLIGILVRPHEEDVDPVPPHKDLRAQNNTVLRLRVQMAVIGDLRTIASGERVRSENRINSPAHDRIRENSPLQKDSLLWRNMLDDYISRLNRFPNRRVDAAVASAGTEDQVSLDYLVAESKPLLAYAQVSNTGTKQTSEWRERIGLIDYQLFGNDDVFTFDYITAGFSAAHAIVPSYEAPLFGSEKTRWRIYGAWSQFDASEVGRSEETFNGEEYTAGGELIRNVLQHHDLFLDAVAGARWRSIMVNNVTGETIGDTNFFLPNAGLRLERTTETSSTTGSLNLEGNVPGVAGTNQEEVTKLGRLYADKSWYAMQWNLSHSFYLEPLLYPQGWEDPQEGSSLANEMAFAFKGQYTQDRLIPQAEEVMGGFYTVRGYKESMTAGDTAMIGTAEYRLHVPRCFKPQAEPGKLLGRPFRFSPQQLRGRPDWDLVLRAFLDAGRTTNNEILPIEQNETLVGTGVGAELQVKRNFNLRVDYGIPLSDVKSSDDTGSGRAYILATLMW